MEILRKTQFLAFMVVSALSLVNGKCLAPPPSTNFTLKGYYGLWYESGKIQTAGGAAFEKDCVCTSIDVQPKQSSTEGDCTAINSCRKNTPQGSFLNATGQLVDMAQPGKWKESFFVFVPKVDYTVIYLDDDFAVEYDCGDILGLYSNYCIHVMARSPNPDPAKVQQLIAFAENLGLNTEKLPYKKTLQEGCW